MMLSPSKYHVKIKVKIKPLSCTSLNNVFAINSTPAKNKPRLSKFSLKTKELV